MQQRSGPAAASRSGTLALPARPLTRSPAYPLAVPGAPLPSPSSSRRTSSWPVPLLLRRAPSTRVTNGSLLSSQVGADLEQADHELVTPLNAAAKHDRLSTVAYLAQVES